MFLTIPENWSQVQPMSWKDECSRQGFSSGRHENENSMTPVGVIENQDGSCHAMVLDHIEFMQGLTLI